MNEIIKLAAAYVTEHPLSSLEDGQLLLDKIAAAIRMGRAMAKMAAPPMMPTVEPKGEMQPPPAPNVGMIRQRLQKALQPQLSGPGRPAPPANVMGRPSVPPAGPPTFAQR